MIDLMRSLQEEAGLTPTVSSYNVVVEALAKASEWTKALDVLAEMKRNGVRPTEFTYSRCMAGAPISNCILKRFQRNVRKYTLFDASRHHFGSTP